MPKVNVLLVLKNLWKKDVHKDAKNQDRLVSIDAKQIATLVSHALKYLVMLK